MRLPTRRAASARRRPPSISRPASVRRASACCSSISTRRRTRRQGSARAPTAPRPTICWTGCRSGTSRSRPGSRTSTSSPPSPSSRRPASSSPRSRGGERYLADALAAGTEPYRFVFLDCPPTFGPLTVNALAAADRVIVPVQAEYYALEGLSQLMGSINLAKASLNPRLCGGGDPAHDGRRADAARRQRSSASCAATSATSSSPRPCPARCVSPRRPATGSLRSPTTAARPARRPTGRWRWSLSSAPSDTPRRGLGRGLEVLIGGSAAQAELLHLPVETIHPNPRQPRRRFEPEATAGLAASIRSRASCSPSSCGHAPTAGSS